MAKIQREIWRRLRKDGFDWIKTEARRDTLEVQWGHDDVSQGSKTIRNEEFALDKFVQRMRGRARGRLASGAVLYDLERGGSVDHSTVYWELHWPGRTKVDKLTFAMKNHDLDEVERLLKSGTPVHKPDSNGNYPLFIAAKFGHTSLVYDFVERGADVDATSGDHQNTALQAAARGELRDVVEALIELGADPHKLDKYGRGVFGPRAHNTAKERKLWRACFLRPGDPRLKHTRAPIDRILCEHADELATADIVELAKRKREHTRLLGLLKAFPDAVDGEIYAQLCVCNRETSTRKLHASIVELLQRRGRKAAQEVLDDAIITLAEDEKLRAFEMLLPFANAVGKCSSDALTSVQEFAAALLEDGYLRCDLEVLKQLGEALRVDVLEPLPKVALVGSFVWGRPMIQRQLEDAEVAHLTRKVTKDTAALFVGQRPTKSVITRAKKLRVPVLISDALYAFVEGADLRKLQRTHKH